MPVQSVELLLDSETEQRVVQVWRALLDAGLPSQARHQGSSNRPHVTLTAVTEMPEGAEAGLAAAVGELPVGASWGPVVEFGHGPWTLVRLLEPSPRMRALQARVAGVCAVADDDLTAPGRWTPHVTLARRVTAKTLPAVRGCVAAALSDPTDPARNEGAPVTATSARRWDGVARREWSVTAAAP